MLSYDELGSFYACAFFPWNMHAHAFTELYGLYVPLFVPTWDLVLKVERLASFPDQIAEVFDARDPRHGAALAGDFSYPKPYWSQSSAAPVEQVYALPFGNAYM